MGLLALGDHGNLAGSKGKRITRKVAWMDLTDEQKEIVARDLRSGEILKIMAFAGTGKTSTLVDYTRSRPHLRFLYLAFNKSVQQEAAEKFPPHVTCRTSHALAFRSHGHRHKNRLVAGFKANTVMAVLQLSLYEDARFAIDTLYNYLISEAPRVNRGHIPSQARAFYQQRQGTMPDFVVLANRLGRLMCDGSDPRIGMLHDGYLKLYQLSRPRLPFDCVLLDEAQDINPVTAALVLAQTEPEPGGAPPASLIVVGDSHQQIYSFRGARDALRHIRATHTRYLTRSFRFGNTIAAVANMVLRVFKGERRRIVGTVRSEPKPPWDPRRCTLIARTNAALFDKAAQLHRTHRIGFVGGARGYRLHLLKDVHFLFTRKARHISDPYIRGFDGYNDLKTYAVAVEDIELLSICKVVENHPSELPTMVDGIMAKAVDPVQAEVVLTTAHKAKGLEWQNVLLLDDYPKLVAGGKLIPRSEIDPDEINLIYVALTRTIANLRFDKACTIPDFIRQVRIDRKHGNQIYPSP